MASHTSGSKEVRMGGRRGISVAVSGNRISVLAVMHGVAVGAGTRYFCPRIGKCARDEKSDDSYLFGDGV